MREKKSKNSQDFSKRHNHSGDKIKSQPVGSASEEQKKEKSCQWEEVNPFQTPFKSNDAYESTEKRKKEQYREKKLSEMSIDTDIKASSISITFTPYAKNNTSLINNLDKLDLKETKLTNQIQEKQEQINSLKSEKLKVKGLKNIADQEPPEQLVHKYDKSHRTEVVSLTVEKTTIRNMQGSSSFSFKVLKIQHGGGVSEVFTSRKTILERPCWRDDTALIEYAPNSHDKYSIQFLQGVKIYDTYQLPPMRELRQEFTDKSKKKFEWTSKSKPIIYTVGLEWSTAEYEDYMEQHSRNKKIQSLQKQKEQLEKKQQAIEDKKKKLEGAISRPYQVQTLSVGENISDQDLQSVFGSSLKAKTVQAALAYKNSAMYEESKSEYLGFNAHQNRDIESHHSPNSQSNRAYEVGYSPKRQDRENSRVHSVLSEENMKQFNEQNEQLDQQGGVLSQSNISKEKRKKPKKNKLSIFPTNSFAVRKKAHAHSPKSQQTVPNSHFKRQSLAGISSSKITKTDNLSSYKSSGSYQKSKIYQIVSNPFGLTGGENINRSFGKSETSKFAGNKKGAQSKQLSRIQSKGDLKENSQEDSENSNYGKYVQDFVSGCSRNESKKEAEETSDSATDNQHETQSDQDNLFEKMRIRTMVAKLGTPQSHIRMSLGTPFWEFKEKQLKDIDERSERRSLDSGLREKSKPRSRRSNSVDSPTKLQESQSPLFGKITKLQHNDHRSMKQLSLMQVNSNKEGTKRAQFGGSPARGFDD